MSASDTDITPEKLREWLEKGKPVSMLDIRPAAEREEWFIPGSRHVDAYRKLWESDPHALDEVDLPTDRPVVTICAAGKTSLLARQVMEEKGYTAFSLLGGMKAWSLAWNVAEVPLPEKGNGDVRILQFRRTGKGCLSYLVGSDDRCVVIDPSLEPDVYLKAAKKQGWTLMASLDTHVHADHLSRARAIEKKTGAPVLLPETNRVSYPYQPVRDSDSIQVGRITLSAMRTPGHTPESVSWRMDNRALFSGDTLFVDSVGRPDLATSAKGAEQRAHALYRSLQHLLSLPAGLLVLPSHTGSPVPFDGRPIMGSLGQVKEAINAIPAGENDFVDWILARIPPTPPNHEAIVKLNEKGQLPDGDPTDLEAGANRCAVK